MNNLNMKSELDTSQAFSRYINPVLLTESSLEVVGTSLTEMGPPLQQPIHAPAAHAWSQ